MKEITSPVLRYHGGKFRIAPWVIEHFPPHRTYVEAFGGAAGVLTRKKPAISEIYNDMDGEIVNVFRVLRNPEQAEQLSKMCALTPYARDEFDLSQLKSDDPVEQARRTLFRAWASFGSAGATRGRSGMRTFMKPDGKALNTPRAWRRLPDMLGLLTERFSNVLIENRPAIDVMKQHDGPETLHYVDPPYLPETRSVGSTRYYRHEMTVDDHLQLLDAIKSLSGFVIVSGYESGMYDDALPGWTRVGLSTSGSSRMGSVQRTECLWLSPRTAEQQPQQDIFMGATA
ncbi:DNA adenine methylase [Kushneria indalinina]|uniref:Site-specific DNA-adenine methylase n=1 Tax=Kushneria indalinina DSM 14324 TaxID=1122140 RepID=A0A3D9DVV4_9GAMM|nr:DNA adenine methylase [Kushneria indalinina]REC94913.1 site-specific DNA-adenine methylase [Kushneria indalinina DSM 14324]